jgi:putative Mg2+ transporter-C (MgtC) family protein
MLFSHAIFGSYELAALLKILLAGIAGGIIGLEREKHGRPAGLRTHLLVAVGACLMMLVSEAFYLKYGGMEAEVTAVRLDPGRVAAQIVTGIGFIGAGVIIKEGMSVRGLTTAASLWLVAGLGMAFGVGLIWPGIVATAVGLFGLIALKRMEPSIQKDRYFQLTVTASTEPDIYSDLEQIFKDHRLKVHSLGSTVDVQNESIVYHMTLTKQTAQAGRELLNVIASLPGVKKISLH